MLLDWPSLPHSDGSLHWQDLTAPHDGGAPWAHAVPAIAGPRIHGAIVTAGHGHWSCFGGKSENEMVAAEALAEKRLIDGAAHDEQNGATQEAYEELPEPRMDPAHSGIIDGETGKLVTYGTAVPHQFSIEPAPAFGESIGGPFPMVKPQFVHKHGVWINEA